MAYWLYRKQDGSQIVFQTPGAKDFSKKRVLKEGKKRNNFTILI